VERRIIAAWSRNSFRPLIGFSGFSPSHSWKKDDSDESSRFNQQQTDFSRHSRFCLQIASHVDASLSRSHVKCLRFVFEIISIGTRIGCRKSGRSLSRQAAKKGNESRPGIIITRPKTLFCFVLCEKEKRLKCRSQQTRNLELI
jgi:hypothetical protein